MKQPTKYVDLLTPEEKFAVTCEIMNPVCIVCGLACLVFTWHATLAFFSLFIAINVISYLFNRK